MVLGVRQQPDGRALKHGQPRGARARSGLLKHLPFYARWYRLLLFWPGTDGILPHLKIDPTWPHADRSINAHNEAWRKQLVAYIESLVGDDPELLKKVVPPYPVMVKRMNQDNGSWFQTLKQPHVTLVSGRIECIDETGIVCDGTTAANDERRAVGE